MLWTTGEVPGDDRCRDLSEREVGHNSAALALRTRRRAEVHGPEHFLDVWQDVSAVSVPLLAPDSGQVLGTVTVASALCVGCGPHPGAALAEAAACAVEAELLARSRTAERVLLDAYTRATRGTDRAIVALDGRNRLISEGAVRLATPQVLTALERACASERGSGYGRLGTLGRLTTHGSPTAPVPVRCRSSPTPSRSPPMPDAPPRSPPYGTRAASSGSSPCWKRGSPRCRDRPRDRPRDRRWRSPVVRCPGGTRSLGPSNWPASMSRCC